MNKRAALEESRKRDLETMWKISRRRKRVKMFIALVPLIIAFLGGALITGVGVWAVGWLLWGIVSHIPSFVPEAWGGFTHWVATGIETTGDGKDHYTPVYLRCLVVGTLILAVFGPLGNALHRWAKEDSGEP